MEARGAERTMLFMKCVLAVGIAALSGSVLAEGVGADANQSAASHILDVSPGGLSPQAAGGFVNYPNLP